MDKKLLLKLTALFLVTQVIGVAVGMSFVSEIQTGEIEPRGIITDNPDDVENALYLFVAILVFTGFFLLMLKLYKGPALFKILEAIVVFSALTIGITPVESLSTVLLGRAIQMFVLFILGPIFSYILIKNNVNNGKHSK